MTTTGKIALFVGGTLFGSAGFKVLGSRDARKVYTEVTAAVLRCKDQIMRDVETVQEACSDIVADAKIINEERAAEAEASFIEDAVTVRPPACGAAVDDHGAGGSAGGVAAQSAGRRAGDGARAHLRRDHRLPRSA